MKIAYDAPSPPAGEMKWRRWKEEEPWTEEHNGGGSVRGWGGGQGERWGSGNGEKRTIKEAVTTCRTK